MMKIGRVLQWKSGVIFLLIASVSTFGAGSSYTASILPVRYNEAVFEEIIVENDIKYGSAITQGGRRENLLMDVYYPKDDSTKKRPLVIFAHGGYFHAGDKAGFAEECEFLAASGYVVASINYRLIDVEETEFVSKRAVIDAVYDQKAAVRFFNKDYGGLNRYRINPEQIFIGGYSAGAVASLHYAYANTAKDLFRMGGEDLLSYVIKSGGAEGVSGNPGYSSKIKGVINIAGSIHSSSLIDEDEPIIVSIHGDADLIVPYFKGKTGETDVLTEGSGLIHARANEIGLTNLLLTVKGFGHDARFYCDLCMGQVRQFIFENLE